MEKKETIAKPKKLSKKTIQAFNDSCEQDFKHLEQYINRDGTFKKKGEVINKSMAIDWDNELRERKEKGKDTIKVFQVERIDHNLVESIKTLSTHKTKLDADRRRIQLEQIKPFSQSHPLYYRVVTNVNKINSFNQ